MSRRTLFVMTAMAMMLAFFAPVQADDAQDKALLYGGVSTRAVNTATNGILTVNIEATTGQFTITTGASHPKPNQTVFYPIGTSYLTLRDVAANLMLHNSSSAPSSAGLTGYTLASLINASTTTAALASPRKGFVTTYTVTNWRVVQEVEINGSSLLNTNVRHLVSITNTSTASRQYGLRTMWDWMIASNDASLFRTRQPDGTFTSTFITHASPTFKLYEEVDNATTPSFSIFGSVQGLPLTPAPTLPEQVRYSYWRTSMSNAWDFTNTGSGGDSSVCYYWGFTTARSLAAGATASFAQYVTTQMEAISPSISVSKAAPATVKSGANLTYTFTIKNSGNATATGVVLSDTIPAGTTYVSATGGTNPVVTSGVFTMTIGDMAAGATKTATLVVKVTATSGSIANRTYSVKANNTGTAYGASVSTSILTGTAPKVTISPVGPLYARPGQSLTFLVTATDSDANARLTLRTSSTLPSGATMTPVLPLTGATGINSRFTWTPCGAVPGDYNLTYTATDETGLTGSATVQILRDRTAPTVTITTPALNAAVATLAAVSGTASDSATGISAPTFILRQASSGLHWSGSAWATAPTALTTTLTGSSWTRTTGLPATTNLTDGLYLIAALAKDGAGNAATAVSSFTVDKTAPAQIEFVAPLHGNTVNSLQLATGWARDNAGGSGISSVLFAIRRSADGKYWSGANATGWVTATTWLTATIWPTTGGIEVTWTVPPRSWIMPSGMNLPNGAYSLTARARDRADNALSKTISITVNNTVNTPFILGRQSAGNPLSSVTAIAASDTVEITFADSVAVAKATPAAFVVGINGEPVGVEAVSVEAGKTVRLSLPAGSLKSGDVIRLRIDGLTFTNGAVYYGATEPFVAE